MRTMLLPACALILTLPAVAYEFDLGSAGTVSVDVPNGWNQPTETRPDESGVQFRISSTIEGNAAVIGTLIVGENFRAAANRIKSEFELLCSPYLARSVEDTVVIHDLDSTANAVGFYATLTDARMVDAPAGGSKTKTFTVCLIVLSDSVKALVFLYCDNPESTVFGQALAIAQSFRHDR